MAAAIDGASHGKNQAAGCLPNVKTRTKTSHSYGTLQIDLVETQTGNMDPKTNFCLIIIQTELERYKFLVRSFVRARVAKVYILENLSVLMMCLILTTPRSTNTPSTTLQIQHKKFDFLLRSCITLLPIKVSSKRITTLPFCPNFLLHYSD